MNESVSDKIPERRFNDMLLDAYLEAPQKNDDRELAIWKDFLTIVGGRTF